MKKNFMAAIAAAATVALGGWGFIWGLPASIWHLILIQASN